MREGSDVSAAYNPRVRPPAGIDVRSIGRRVWVHWVVRPFRQILLTEHPAWERFFSRRCPHLAGMIAYFGILSIIPAAFLFVSALGFAGYLEAQGWVVTQLSYVMPEQGVSTITRTVNRLRESSGSLGLIGLFGLVWGTSNFFSCIESGLNIIYGVNNRVFLRQKALVLLLMLFALVMMTLGTIAVTISSPVLQKADKFANTVLHFDVTESGISLAVSALFAFFYFLSCYRFLPNVEIHTRDVWRGALLATIGFEVSIHLLLRYLSVYSNDVVMAAFQGAFIVMIWFYLMAFILLVGGTFNWWRVEKRRRFAQHAA
jgi:membrane protein